MPNFNDQVITEFRANSGQVKGVFEGMQLMLMTTTGAKSGQKRIIPVAYITHGDDYVIVASKGGAPTNPDWYFNLIAHPEVTVEIPGDTFTATARLTEDPEREQLFAELAAKYPQFNEYKTKTSRVLPVFLLSRKS